ncbi:peptidoglycan-binding protein [Methyloraptor flagellatus]|uniref:Peptidoglycan-binding domain-containing protein n=1 Tax=Methyloraptor flagellatus TaxID=3162530 RepID=A0AAU7X4C2_9HYPH
MQKIQRALIATGYGPLKADGRMDARTKEQIRRYEVAHGWPATGQISDRLILDLLVTAVTR